MMYGGMLAWACDNASGSSTVVPGGIDQLSGRKVEDLAASLDAE